MRSLFRLFFLVGAIGTPLAAESPSYAQQPPALCGVEIQSSFYKDGRVASFLINGYFQTLFVNRADATDVHLTPTGAVQLDCLKFPDRQISILVQGKPVKLTYRELAQALIDATRQEWDQLPAPAKRPAP